MPAVIGIPAHYQVPGAPFDARAWHHACVVYGLALTSFTVPRPGSVVELRGVVNDQPIAAWVFRGLVTVWAAVQCQSCGVDIQVEVDTSKAIVDALVEAIVRTAPAARCVCCRDAQR